MPGKPDHDENLGEAVTYDLAYDIVPENLRRGSFSMGLLWLSTQTNFAGMFIGFTAQHSGQSLQELLIGCGIGAVCLCIYGFAIGRTRWGLEMRAIGGNAEASLRLGVPVSAYIIGSMVVAGGVAGLAGMAEVSAIQGRLVAQLSPGYGFMGFLVAWLAGGSAVGILMMAALFAVLSSVGDVLQITQGVPFSVINLLMAAILFIVLGERGAGGRR